jgi:hypothetical protein
MANPSDTWVNQERLTTLRHHSRCVGIKVLNASGARPEAADHKTPRVSSTAMKSGWCSENRLQRDAAVCRAAAPFLRFHRRQAKTGKPATRRIGDRETHQAFCDKVLSSADSGYFGLSSKIKSFGIRLPTIRHF